MARTPCQWSHYWPVPDLHQDEVHVARLSLNEASDFLALSRTFLSQDELDREARFRFEADRDGFVLTRGCLRAIVARYLDVLPGELRLGTNQFGKPILVGLSSGRSVQFNVSHSGTIAVFVVAGDRRVGVDVERVREDLPYRDMAARFFSTAELRTLESRPSGTKQIAHFFRTWTRKEAYVKGRGQGFTISPERFSVVVDDEGPSPVDDRGCSSRPGSWRTVEIDVADGYACAVAVEGADWSMRCFEAVDVLASTNG